MRRRRVSKPRTRIQRNTRTEVMDVDRRPRSAREREEIERALDEIEAEIDAVLDDFEEDQ